MIWKGMALMGNLSKPDSFKHVKLCCGSSIKQISLSSNCSCQQCVLKTVEQLLFLFIFFPFNKYLLNSYFAVGTVLRAMSAGGKQVVLGSSLQIGLKS